MPYGGVELGLSVGSGLLFATGFFVGVLLRSVPEDCLWAKSWKGLTILSTGGRSLTTLMLPIMPKGLEEPPTLIHPST